MPYIVIYIFFKDFEIKLRNKNEIESYKEKIRWLFLHKVIRLRFFGIETIYTDRIAIFPWIAIKIYKNFRKFFFSVAAPPGWRSCLELLNGRE